MTTGEYTIRICFGRAIIMVVTVACLCLSSGEGLRLRLFPVSELEETEATNRQLRARASNAISTRCNPVTVSSRPLPRVKQQAVDHETPLAHSSRELTTHVFLSPITGGDMDIVALFLGSRIPGRAPPFTL
jgi:hypothetical protein